MPLHRKRSLDGAITDGGSRHLIAAYYSFIDPEKMNGWYTLIFVVLLVGANFYLRAGGIKVTLEGPAPLDAF